MAQPQGLYLMDVKYPEHVVKDSSKLDWQQDGRPTKQFTTLLPIDDEMREQLKKWDEEKEKQTKEKALQDEKAKSLDRVREEEVESEDDE
jgi:hypothetical protein